MRPRQRDRSFLVMAILAATGGVLSIVLAIGLPLWVTPSTPAFHLFACWGIFALAGAYGCLHTYFLTDTPPRRPPPGGLPITQLHGVSAQAAQPHPAAAEDLAA